MNDFLINVELNYPDAREWMWSYCLYLGPWTSPDGTVYDMGAYKNQNGSWSAACVYGNEEGSYISGVITYFETELYHEVLRRLQELKLAPTMEDAYNAVTKAYEKVLKETRGEREEILKDCSTL